MQPRDLQVEKILSEGKNNPDLPSGLTDACLKAMFESSRTYGLFTTYFDEELYMRSAKINGIVGVAKVLEDVEISQRNHTPYRDVQRFLEQDFAIIHRETQLPDNFKPHITARIFLKLMTAGDFDLVSVSDDRAKVTNKPVWLKNNDKCYLIFSATGNLEIVAKASGNVTLNLGGMRVKNPDDNSKLLPYWIDYTKLTVNDKVIFDTLTPAWFNKQYRYDIAVKAGDEIKIQVEWLPHRSDT